MTAEQALEGMQGLLRQIVGQCHHKYGGDRQELLSAAYEAFVKAHQTYEEGREATLITWVRFHVWRGLLELQRIRPMIYSPHLSQRPDLRHHFDIARFLNELSQEAREVISLVLAPPLEVMVGSERQQRGSQIRKALIRFLKQTGWCSRRINETFNEIREAL